MENRMENGQKFGWDNRIVSRMDSWTDKRMKLPQDLDTLLTHAKRVILPESRNDILDLAMGGGDGELFEVAYEVPEKGRVVEATVARAKNGLVINYADLYMRRRDPDCMVIADDGRSDKPHYRDRYGDDFTPLRNKTFTWLSEQDLLVLPFYAGGEQYGYPALLVAPANAGFFAGGLADLQGFVPASDLPEGFAPKVVIYLAPTFRHTHFDGRQMVVHNRQAGMYELFSYNLYPGPSAKKGVYGFLIQIGEEEGWITAHGSTVRIVTPYDNAITLMHEGASGGGKSEMIEEIHREMDGKIHLSTNLVTGEVMKIDLADTCELHPVTDDMALCHPELQNESRKLVVTDAEQGWFLRTNHIVRYGTDPYLESLTVHPPEPLIFLNYETRPGSTCLLWEHAMDAPGKACPNPRVIMPRRFVPRIVKEPVEVDVRSFGVRTPPCTKEHPTYGILGLFHILPPALAWLWRLVAPRGHDNPSITETAGMSSEGVGSYWPFATGSRVEQANLLLRQVLETPNTRYILIPNQHIGAYHVGFMPQWIAREYLARRGGARFSAQQLRPSKSSLLGYSLGSVKVEGTVLPKELLEVDRQPEVGLEGFAAGAQMLHTFFLKELAQYDTDDLDPLGRQILACVRRNATVEVYVDLIPMRL